MLKIFMHFPPPPKDRAQTSPLRNTGGNFPKIFHKWQKFQKFEQQNAIIHVQNNFWNKKPEIYPKLKSFF